MGVRLNILAADIHRRMVADDRFGYSWSERYGANPERWVVDGVPIDVKVGDYDCSSSTITAWRLALKAAGHADPLPGATYTGNMRSVFTRSGLFEWVPASQAQRGDLYLNEANHVAMCQGGGRLSEFSGNEFGGAYGGVRGDQTGWEAHETGYYSYPWDGCLHYVGTKEIPTIEEELMKAVDVWAYCNKAITKLDAYALLNKAANPWGYKGNTRRGGKVVPVEVDAYQLLNDIHHAIGEVAGKLDAISEKLG